MFAADLATLTVTTPLARHQICQVAFSGKDGSVFITFPYFLGPSDGIISSLTFPANKQGAVQLDLKEGGKATAHRVKAAHHSSGRAHFSLMPLVKGSVGRQSFPLETHSGLLFQLHCYWLSGFKHLPLDGERRKRLYIHFATPDPGVAGITITGEWRRMDELPPNLVINDRAEPFIQVLAPTTGKPSPVALLAAPADGPLSGHCVLLQADPLEPLPGMPVSTMVYLGGFDFHSVPVGMPAAPGSGCIAFFYPIPDLPELVKIIGSADESS